MRGTVAVAVASDDIAITINSTRAGPSASCARYVDGCKGALTQQKAMCVTAAIRIGPDDVASLVDRICKRT